MVQLKGHTQSQKSCPLDTETLQLIIETGDVLFAGTDDNVNLLLRSTNGVICRAMNLDNPGNDRKRNHVDEYNICCPKGFLSNKSEISMLLFGQMVFAGKTCPGNNDWFVERIELRADGQVLLEYRFHDWSSPMKQWVFGLTKIGSNYTRF
jgi:hypothetical protein